MKFVAMQSACKGHHCRAWPHFCVTCVARVLVGGPVVSCPVPLFADRVEHSLPELILVQEPPWFLRRQGMLTVACPGVCRLQFPLMHDPAEAISKLQIAMGRDQDEYLKRGEFVPTLFDNSTVYFDVRVGNSCPRLPVLAAVPFPVFSCLSEYGNICTQPSHSGSGSALINRGSLFIVRVCRDLTM